MPQSETSARLSARTGPRIYLALLATLAVAACFLPLADHVGYEFSQLIAMCAGMFGCIPGIVAGRDSKAPVAMRRSLTFGLSALLLPLAIILLNGLRRPPCDPLHGLPLYFLLTVPSAALSAAVGVVCAKAWPRHAGLLYSFILLGSLPIALLPVARGPQVFAYHHFLGMYPGPIYDESIALTPALLWFRLATVLYVIACVALIAGSLRAGALGIAALCGAIAISMHAEPLHFRASTAALDAELGGRLETDHMVLHFPREKTPDERALLAQDAEADVRGVLQFLGISSGAKVDVYLYRSAQEKRTLIGAADTSFTKPWLHQIHTNDMPAPHIILRHELVHALAAPIAHGPWGVPGIIPRMPLVEGIAVAGDWPPGEFTVHEEALALRELKLLPDMNRLFLPGRFYDESGPRAYTAAGSFIRWFWETRGAAALRDVYSGTTRLDTEKLVPEYLAYLDKQLVPPRAVAIAQQRFFAPAITRKPCAHEVAGLEQQARDERDPAAAALLWSKCTQLEPDDPQFLVQLRRSQAAAGDTKAAQETERRALAHPKLSQPLRAQVLTEAGDAAWKSGDLATAQQRFTEAGELTQSEPAERALRIRTLAVRDRTTWPALQPLLADADTSPRVLLALRDLDLTRPADGLYAYLLAKQLQNARNWEECFKYAQSASNRSLPSPLFVDEALRMRGIAAWHLHDAAAARAAFTQLGRNAPPGRALDAQRWLERIQ
jgi:hypothetical protein